MAKGVKLVTVNDNLVSFTMGLKRDSLTAPEHTIRVEIDVTNVSREALLKMLFSGQSARVKLQTRLRKKTDEALYRLEKSVYKITWKKLFEEDSYADIMMTLSREDFVRRVMLDYKCDETLANNLYNSKHANDNDDNE